jgi:predicted dehydrogenase
MTPPLRVGVIGCGLIAQVMHLPYLRELGDRFQLAALCDASPGTLAGVADRYGIHSRFTEWGELVKQPLDAVFVLMGGSHAPAAIAAAKRGLHVFVEKPMCFTLREADELITAADASGATIFVGNMKRYDPAFEQTRRELARLEHLRFVRVTTLEAPLQPYVDHYSIIRIQDLAQATVAAQLADRVALAAEALGSEASDSLKAAYVDLLLDSAVHELNLLRGFLGDPTRVLAAEIWDEGRSLQATLEFGPDVRAGVSLVWLAHLREYRQEIAFYGPDRRVAIEFPSPFLKNSPTRVVVEELDDGATWRREGTVSYDEAFKLELEAFYECVLGRETPRTTARDGRRDIQLAQTIAMAVRDGRSIAFPKLD